MGYLHLPSEWDHLSSEDFIEKWYTEEYSRNSYCDAAGFAQRLMHKSIERPWNSHTFFETVLEIGGNRGEHLQHVSHQFQRYIVSDIRDRRKFIDAQTFGVSFQLENAESLTFSDNSFDRVLCCCVLHHLDSPESALHEMRRVTKELGRIDIFLSCDPGWAFRVARYFGPVRAASRRNLGDVKRLIDARDHQNHVASLSRLIHYVFRSDTISVKSYPLPFCTWNFSWWKIYRIVKS